MQRRHAHALLAAARTLAVDPGLAATGRLIEILRGFTGADAVALLVDPATGTQPERRAGLGVAEALGLELQVHGRTLRLGEHPRLGALAAAEAPVCFAPDDPRPDPWDGLLSEAPEVSVHACAGVSLRADDGRLRGLLTLDAVSPRRFGPELDAPLSSFASLMNLALDQRGAGLEPGRSGRASGAGRRLIGAAPAVVALRRELELVAASELPVMIEGETGVGKELVAEAVHAASRRADRPLVRINCAALPASLAESELFGHRRGAFTGANADYRGAFARADGGTILLDELGELEPLMQAKLLRVLQTGELPILGDERGRRVDVRVTAASNRELDREVAAGRFRADLWYRVAGCRLRVPALRERGRDVIALAGHFLAEAGAALGILDARLSAAAQRCLLAHPWPGNVRELEHCVARACLRAAARSPRIPVLIEPADLGLAPAGAVLLGLPVSEGQAGAEADAGDGLPEDGLAVAVDELRRSLIERAVALSEGNWAEAARRLQLDRSNLHRMARRLGLK